jgi:hypothetical protein
MKSKTKTKVSNIMLVISCIMITLYTAANFILQYFTSVEVSPTLTTAWFTFWSSELFLLAGIKISKVLTNKDTDNQESLEATE